MFLRQRRRMMCIREMGSNKEGRRRLQMEASFLITFCEETDGGQEKKY